MENDLKAEIARELYEAFRSFGAKSDLLRIVGSYGATLTDHQVLEQLRGWNAINPQTDVEPPRGFGKPD